MFDLINLYYSRYQHQTVSSIEIAKNTGRKHEDILKECDVLNKYYRQLALPLIEERIYINPNDKAQQREFFLTKEQQSNLFIVSIVDSLDHNSRQLVLNLLDQPIHKTQKPIEPINTIEPIKKSKRGRPRKFINAPNVPKETAPETVKLNDTNLEIKPTKPVKPPKEKNKKIKPPKAPKHVFDTNREEKGLTSIVEIVRGQNISRGDVYQILRDAQVIETITYPDKKGVIKKYNVITEKYAHLGTNERLNNKTKVSVPL